MTKDPEIIGAITLISKTTLLVGGRFVTQEIFAGRTDQREGFWYWRYDPKNKPTRMNLLPGDPRRAVELTH